MICGQQMVSSAGDGLAAEISGVVVLPDPIRIQVYLNTRDAWYHLTPVKLRHRRRKQPVGSTLRGGALDRTSSDARCRYASACARNRRQHRHCHGF